MLTEGNNPERTFTYFDRLLFASVVSGAAGGALAGLSAGAWARVAMRLVAEWSPMFPRATWEGSLFVIGFGGFLGLIGGLFFGAFLAFAPGRARRKGLFWGIILYTPLIIGAYLSAPLPGEAGLLPLETNLALFAPCFVVYGVVIGRVEERVLKRISPSLLND